MSTEQLEQRMAAVEAEVAALRQQGAAGNRLPADIRSMIGSVADVPEFDQMMEHVRRRRAAEMTVLEGEPASPGLNGHPKESAMTPEQLDQRLSAIEAGLQQLRASVDALRNGTGHRSGTPPVPDAESDSESLARAEADANWWEEWEPYRKYLRQTGRMPPDSWKPGDPIPEPDWW